MKQTKTRMEAVEREQISPVPQEVTHRTTQISYTRNIAHTHIAYTHPYVQTHNMEEEEE